MNMFQGNITWCVFSIFLIIPARAPWQSIIPHTIQRKQFYPRFKTAQDAHLRELHRDLHGGRRQTQKREGKTKLPGFKLCKMYRCFFLLVNRLQTNSASAVAWPEPARQIGPTRRWRVYQDRRHHQGDLGALPLHTPPRMRAEPRTPFHPGSHSTFHAIKCLQTSIFASKWYEVY
jgi:hypothetical protein